MDVRIMSIDASFKEFSCEGNKEMPWWLKGDMKSSY